MSPFQRVNYSPPHFYSSTLITITGGRQYNRLLHSFRFTFTFPCGFFQTRELKKKKKKKTFQILSAMLVTTTLLHENASPNHGLRFY